MTSNNGTKWSYAICNELFVDWPLEKVAAYVAEKGYQGLELAPFTLGEWVTDVSSNERRQIRQRIEKAGLAVVGLHWLLARTAGLQLNSPDPATRERTVQYLLDLIDFCADVGGEVLIFGSPDQRSLQPGWSLAQAWESSAEIMSRCGERARERGVMFCLEPLTSQETDFLNTVDQVADMVRQVNHPHLQMMVDVRAMSHDPRPIPEQIRLVVPLVRHVHVNDPNLLGPGMGEVDYQPILAVLDELDYSGWLSVEVFDYSPGPERIVQESLMALTQPLSTKS